MSSSSRADVRRTAAGSNDPGATAPSHPRSTIDRLTLQSDAAATTYDETPEVIELEAAGLDAARFEMTGATKTLAGDMDEGNFRAMWRGDRAPVTLREICRVRLTGRPEGRRATDALLSVLTNAGRTAEAITLDKAFALLKDTTSSVEAIVRKLDDGLMSKEEAADALPAFRALMSRGNQILASLEATAQEPMR